MVDPLHVLGLMFEAWGWGVLGVGCLALVAEWVCGRSPDDEG